MSTKIPCYLRLKHLKQSKNGTLVLILKLTQTIKVVSKKKKPLIFAFEYFLSHKILEKPKKQIL